MARYVGRPLKAEPESHDMVWIGEAGGSRNDAL